MRPVPVREPPYMLRSIRPARAIPALAFVSILLSFTSGGHSQTPELFPMPPRPTNPGMVDALRDGQLPLSGSGKTLALNDEQKTELTRVAEYMVRRVALVPFNGEPLLGKDNKSIAIPFNDNVSFLAAEIARMIPKSQQKDGTFLPAQIVYSKEMAAAVRKIVATEILSKPVKPIVRVNAVRLMSIAARIPDAAWADDFMKILTSTRESGAVKLYALQGLGNALASPSPTDPTRALIEDTVRLEKIATFLQGFIAKPVEEMLTTQDQMVARYLRREAIAALGQFRNFSIREPGTGRLLASPGYTLLTIANGTLPLVPEIGGPEQTEALIAVLAMKPDSRANLKVVGYGLATGMIEVVGFLGRDKERIAAGEVQTPKVVSLPEMHWKIVGNRVSENARALEVNSSTPEIRTVEGSADLVLMSKYAATKFGPILEKDGYKAQVNTAELDNLKNARRLAGDKLVVLPNDKIPSELVVR